MSDTEQNPSAATVSDSGEPNTRMKPLEEVGTSATQAGDSAAQLAQSMKAVNEQLDSSSLSKFREDLKGAAEDAKKLNEILEEGGSEKHSSFMHSFGRGMAEEVKKEPGVGTALSILKGGSEGAEAVGGLAATAGIESVKFVGEHAIEGVEDNIQRDSSVNTAALALTRSDKAAYPTHSSALDAATQAADLIEQKADGTGPDAKSLMASYTAAVPDLVGAGITKIDDQVNILTSLIKSAHLQGADDAAALKDTRSFLAGNVKGTVFEQEFGQHNIGDSEVQKARKSRDVPQLVNQGLADSEDASTQEAESTGGLMGSIGSRINGLFAKITRPFGDLIHGSLASVDGMLGEADSSLEKSGWADSLKVPRDKKIDDEEATEAENREQSGAKIATLSKSVPDAILTARATEAVSPAQLAQKQSQADTELGLKQATLDAAEQDELHSAGDDESRRSAVSTKYAKQRNENSGKAATDSISRQIEAKQLQIDSYNDALDKQKQVMQAANAEADRTQTVAGKEGPRPSESRSTLLAQRKKLADEFTTVAASPAYEGGDMETLEDAKAEHDQKKEAIAAQINDVDKKLHLDGLYVAATDASWRADRETAKYGNLKKQTDAAIAPKLQDIQYLKTDAETVSLKTRVANERIDGDGSTRDRELKRHRRNADLDIDIGEAETSHDESKANKLREKKNWLNKYDELRDVGEPEWQARRGANLSSLDKNHAGHDAMHSEETFGMAVVESLASARNVSHNSDAPQNSNELMTVIKGIATSVADLKNKWASTPIKVEARFS